MFEAQPSKCTLTSSYELCHRSPLAGRAVARACTDRVSSCWTVDAISTWIRHTHTELLTFRTLNEGVERIQSEFNVRNPHPQTFFLYGTHTLVSNNNQNNSVGNYIHKSLNQTLLRSKNDNVSSLRAQYTVITTKSRRQRMLW